MYTGAWLPFKKFRSNITFRGLYFPFLSTSHEHVMVKRVELQGYEHQVCFRGLIIPYDNFHNNQVFTRKVLQVWKKGNELEQ